MDDLESVESGFPGNVFGVAGVDEGGVADLVVPVVLHPEPVDGLIDPDADLGGAAEGSAIDALADGSELGFGRLQQGFAVVGAPRCQPRVAKGPQPLTGIVRVKYLEQIDFVEPGGIKRASADKPLDACALQRGDPIHAIQLLEFGDAGLRDHAVIAKNRHPLEAEALPQACDIRQKGLRIPDIARVVRDGNRAAADVAQQIRS